MEIRPTFMFRSKTHFQNILVGSQREFRSTDRYSEGRKSGNLKIVYKTTRVNKTYLKLLFGFDQNSLDTFNIKQKKKSQVKVSGGEHIIFYWEIRTNGGCHLGISKKLAQER